MFWLAVCKDSRCNLKIVVTMKNTGLCLLSMLSGAVVGAALTVLLTPKSGPEMRDAIRDYVTGELERVRCKCNEMAHHHEVSPSDNA